MVAAGIGGFLLCAVTSALIYYFGASNTGDGAVAGHFPPPPLEGVPFHGPHLLYYLCAGLFYLALTGLGFALVGMALTPRRKTK